MEGDESHRIVMTLTHVENVPGEPLWKTHNWKLKLWLDGKLIEHGRFYSPAAALDEAMCSLAAEGIETELEEVPE